jgi:hypothetical protein
MQGLFYPIGFALAVWCLLIAFLDLCFFFWRRRAKAIADRDQAIDCTADLCATASDVKDETAGGGALRASLTSLDRSRGSEAAQSMDSCAGNAPRCGPNSEQSLRALIDELNRLGDRMQPHCVGDPVEYRAARALTEMAVQLENYRACFGYTSPEARLVTPEARQ